MIDVEMSIQDVINVFGTNAYRPQAFKIAAVEHVHFVFVGPRLIVSDASVDQNDLTADAQKPALHRHTDMPGLRIVMSGAQPAFVRP